MPARKRTTEFEKTLLSLEVFELLEAHVQSRHIYALLKRIIEMSVNEAEAIAQVQGSVAAVDTKIVDLTTAVNKVIVAAGDDPAKIAALDGVAAQLTSQQNKLQSLTDAANAALVTPTPPTP